MCVLISGGPGSGCTSTAKLLGDRLGIPVLDSDSFFHKPTNPPFQEQYSPVERRRLLSEALAQSSDWILSGSIATWDVDLPTIHFGVFMDIPKKVRMRRLELRERERFGDRIDVGGDMHTEKTLFMEWALAYEDRSGRTRNRVMDRDFLIGHCDHFIEVRHSQSLEEITSKIQSILANPTKRRTSSGGSGPE
tara:strand:- start:1483 stop:2058 length:576 start_codon:yes stop_codon:yes gene_type:complete